MTDLRAVWLLPMLAALSPALAQAPSGARIDGVVVDTVSGAPVRRAVIQLRRSGSGPAISIESADYAAVTGPDGTFRFERLAPGSYSLSYSRVGYLLPRSSSSYSPRDLQVSAGQAVSGLRYGLIPQAIVSGRVVDDEGDPVEGAQVSLFAFRYGSGMRRLTQTSETGTTNDRGEYRVVRIPSGKYFVQASLDRLPPGSTLLAGTKTPGGPLVGYGSTFYPGVADSGQAMRVDLRAGQELPGIDIPLQRTAMVLVTGRLVGPDGAPMQGASLMLISAQSHMPAGMGAPADALGNFVLNNVRSGSYILTAFGGDARSISVPLEVGSTDITGFVAQASLPLPLHGSVSVEDAVADFNPASVSVNLRLADTGASAGTVRPEADGSFSFESLPQGRYFASVGCGGSGVYVQSITVGGEEVRGRDFDLTSASNGLRIVLRGDSASLSGTVESQANGSEPARREGHPAVILMPADARLRGIDSIAPAPVSAKGSFDIPGLRPGEYLVMAFDDVDASQLQDPEFLSTLEPLGVRVQLAPGAKQTVTLKWNVWPQTAAGY